MLYQLNYGPACVGYFTLFAFFVQGVFAAFRAEFILFKLLCCFFLIDKRHVIAVFAFRTLKSYYISHSSSSRPER